MRVPLPERDCELLDGKATVKGQILYIHCQCFDDVMYELTYLVKGDERCYYCGAPIKTAKTAESRNPNFANGTLDHIFPKSLGGPTIPNNLAPSCQACNSLKESMMPDEFSMLRKLRGQEPKDWKAIARFYEDLERRFYNRATGKTPVLPKKWLSYNVQLEGLLLLVDISSDLGESYQKKLRLYDKYKHIPWSLVISRNGVLLSGYTTLKLAIEKGVDVDKLNVIVLENVIYDGKIMGE